MSSVVENCTRTAPFESGTATAWASARYGCARRTRSDSLSSTSVQTSPCLTSRNGTTADSRVGASAVVDLAAQAPVRRRFGFDDEELDRVRASALESGARWGEAVSRRERYQHGVLAQGTWATAPDPGAPSRGRGTPAGHCL
jgi:hypothetical protein